MASFYDSASIITIPSGYKAGTLYSQIPTDGAGDMTFTRTGDTATRVNSAGIIERCITNSALQSNNFSNASWTKSNVNIAGSIADPNGGTTAFSMAGSSSTSNAKNIAQAIFSSTSDVKTFSIYAKANTHSFIQVKLQSAGVHVNFDLTNGTLSNGASAVGTITSIGGGWYRCQMTTTAASTNTVGAVQLVDSLSAANNESSTTTNSVYIWRSQAQTGDFATNYIDTTTAAVTQGPVTNLPRLDYFGSTCPQLLMEPTRTNLHTYSQMIDNAAWTKVGTSASGNVVVSPDGYTNADVMVEDTTNAVHTIRRSISVTSGTVYSFSSFVKQGSGTRRFGIVLPTAGFGSAQVVSFNLINGTFTTSSGSITGKIENYGNGWYRCIATSTATATNASVTINYALMNSSTYETYIGDGTSSLYVWGAQVEAGAYATSYIPTTAATVTRNNDDCSKTGISDLIGQTEGTLFYDMDIELLSGTTSATLTNVNDGSVNNRLRIVTATSSRIRFLAQINGGVTTLDYTFSGIYTTRTRIKIAIGYKSGDSVIYINGIRRFTSASTLTISSPLSANSIVNATEATKFNQVLLFKTRLTDDQLATLTTL